MESSASILGAGAPESAGQAPFRKAIDDFLAELSQRQKDDTSNPFLLELINGQKTPWARNGGSPQSDESADTLRKTVERLESQQHTGLGYRLLHRLSPFIESLRNLLKKCEQFSQATPFGVHVAFVGARIVLELAIKVHEYLETVVTAMDRIAGILNIYDQLSSSVGLQPRLTNSYKKIIMFWYKVSKVLSSSRLKGVVSRSMVLPLKRETEEALKDLQEDMHINLGNTQAMTLLLTESDRQARLKTEDMTLRNDIVNWIRGPESVDILGDYQDRLDLRHEGTCTWIFADRRFEDWRDARGNALLWYNAAAGTGKSVLAAVVVDHLMSRQKKVVYFFYSFNKSCNRHLMSGLRYLALQLLTLVDTLSDRLLAIYQSGRQLASHLNSERIAIDVVHELVTRQDDIYIVVDGLDECVDEEDKLPLLEDLVQRTTLGAVKWLFTSRVTDVRKSMNKLQAATISSDPDVVLKNIQKDIQKYLSANISCQDNTVEWTKENETNFLYARFVCDTLRKLTSEDDIREELRSFPVNLDGYYARALERIATRSEKEQEVARRIFLTLAIAEQSVSLDELVDALAIRRGASDYRAARLPQPDLVEDLCGSLIIFEKRTKESGGSPVVRLCHKSVKDFFLRNPDTVRFDISQPLRRFFFTPPEAEEELGLDCLTYLKYSRYSKPLELKAILEDVPKEHAFLRYAATFWFQHLYKKSQKVVEAVEEFVGSRAFWTCLQVQSHVVGYLFGRFDARDSGYQMGIRGGEWKEEDRFGLPLPTWLSESSANGLMFDRSLCSFADEWREVIITCPEGLSCCVPMRPFAKSCYLKPLVKNNMVQSLILDKATDTEGILDFKLLNVYFLGKKLWLDTLHRKKDGVADEVWRCRQPLFKRRGEPSKTCYKLPLGSDSDGWIMCAAQQEDVDGALDAWNIECQTLSVKRTTESYSKRYSAPAIFCQSNPDKPCGDWVVLSCVAELAGKGASTLVFHMARGDRKRIPRTNNQREDEEDNSETSYPSSSESGEDDTSDDNWSDDDDSVSSKSHDDLDSGDDVPEAPQQESTTCRGYDTECLILIPRGGSPFWMKSWTHSPRLWSRIICAIHPTRPLAVCTHAVLQLELVNLESATERTISLPELPDLQEEPVATIRELRFSACGNYIHLLSISFANEDTGTKCCIAVSTFKADISGANDITLLRLSDIRCAYSFGDRLSDVRPPFALTYWSDDYVIVALPPLTCDPRIMKVVLNSGHDGTTILTLREPIYFPTSTPRREARLMHRRSTEGAEGYVYLVLSALGGDAAGQGAGSGEGSPPVVLRWGVSDADGWRPWDVGLDGQSTDLKNGAPAWKVMKGTFVESGKPFSVPIRSGLNWNRKGFLSCG